MFKLWVIRTDFSDENQWDKVRQLILAAQNSGFGMFHHVKFVSREDYRDKDPRDLVLSLPDNYPHLFCFVVDRESIVNQDHRVLVVGFFPSDEPRGRPPRFTPAEQIRTFRALPSQIQGIENNLSRAWCEADFKELANLVDKDGVFRCFPRSERQATGASTPAMTASHSAKRLRSLSGPARNVLKWCILGGAVLVLAVVCWSALTEPAREQQRKAESALASSDRLIVLGSRIGPLRLTGKIDDIVKLFGPGTVRHMGQEAPEIFRLQTWDAIGLWVQFDPETGNIVWISVGTSGSNPWAQHSTPDGIRLGTSQKELVSVMGDPERTVTGGGGTSFYYDRRGIRFTLHDSGARAGTVGAVRVVWPSVPRGDTVIVPGKRISNIEVGAPIDKALAALGGGYHRGERDPGFANYYWPHLGVSFVERAGRAISVSAARHTPADAPDIRYATAEGLGIGSSAADIKKIYGEPPETGRAGGWLHWTYRSHGVSFALDDDFQVTVVDVFPPEQSGRTRLWPRMSRGGR